MTNTTPTKTRPATQDKSWNERLANVLDVLKEKSGCRVTSIKNVIASIQRKERTGKLPANMGFAFAAHNAKTALVMAELAGFPCRSEFAERMMHSEIERAERWLDSALNSLS